MVKVLLMNGYIFSNTCTLQQSDHGDAGRWERLAQKKTKKKTKNDVNLSNLNQNVSHLPQMTSRTQFMTRSSPSCERYFRNPDLCLGKIYVKTAKMLNMFLACITMGFRGRNKAKRTLGISHWETLH